ncbi:MAG: hypothetical protein S4CHLAM102_13860 [Chlamydiia bacterium]|nr:hypothetical protein [Chlamydiia bacterium]
MSKESLTIPELIKVAVKEYLAQFPVVVLGTSLTNSLELTPKVHPVHVTVTPESNSKVYKVTFDKQ